MKEIKFRQRLRDGRFHYWGFVGGGFIAPAIGGMCGYQISINEALENSDQYTGLKDKSGKKEIYGGDIVEVNHPLRGDEEPFLGKVFWHEHDGQWVHTFLEGRPSKSMWEWAMVVGNIYDNPELLNK